MKNRKLHFGVLLSSVEESCQTLIWQGVNRFASENGIAVTVFIGTFQQKAKVVENHYDVALDFAKSASHLDGVLLLGGQVSGIIGVERAEEYYNQFNDIPLVSISMIKDGVTSFLVDNYQGMYSIVEHLVTSHNIKNPIFISGPKGHYESEIRLTAYLDVLKKYDIKANSNISYSDFSFGGGANSISKFIDRGVEFDSVVSVDDDTAIGVIDRLKSLNYLVPQDVVVTGFDDIDSAKILNPALTTIMQPFTKLGYEGASALLSIIDGEKLPPVTLLPCDLRIRRSCGCVPSTFVDSSEFKEIVELKEFKAHLIKKFEEKNVPPEVSDKWLDRLNHTLMQRDFSVERFVLDFEDILSSYTLYSKNLEIWFRLLNRYTSFILHAFKNDKRTIERLHMLILHGAAVIGEITLQTTRRLEQESEHTQWKIRGIAHRISTSFDMLELREKILDGFSNLGVKRVLVALYPEEVAYDADSGWKEPESLIPVFAMNRGEEIDLTAYEPIIDFVDLMDYENKIFGNLDRLMLCMPLFFGKVQLGVMLIEESKGQPIDMYETLRLSVSTALKGASLFDEVRELSIKDELTGLYNRRGFMVLANSRLNHMSRSNNLVSIHFVDMDGLKKVNDTYGHKEGDRAIMIISSILSETIREDDIVGRIGGDEFVILTTSLKSNGDREFTTRIKRAFEVFNESSDLEYSVNCSIGSVIADTTENCTLDSLIQQADLKLYNEKMRKKS